MYHYAVVDRISNIVKFVGSSLELFDDDDDAEMYVQIDFHDPALVGKKYVAGNFVEG